MVSFSFASIASVALLAVSASAASISNAEHKGEATFYTPSDDNCGTSSSENDLVVAISQHELYEPTANDESISSYCGKHIKATYKDKSVTAKIVDSCESCDLGHIDFSPAAFSKLADQDLGVLPITWKVID